jgi:hypothetical protein
MTADRPTTNPVLQRLAVFVGAWRWEAVVDGAIIGRGTTEFAWLEDGFLLQHTGAETAEFPSSVTVISGDDTTDTYCQLHSDSRGVSRIYQMRLQGGVCRRCGATLLVGRSDSWSGDRDGRMRLHERWLPRTTTQQQIHACVRQQNQGQHDGKWHIVA